MNQVVTVLKSIVYSKYFWIILVSLILIIILKKNWYKIKLLLQPSDINLEDGEPVNISSIRQEQLESYALSLYNSIYGSHDNDAYDVALSLTDNELKYLSVHYRRNLTQGVYLYSDIDNETFSTWNDRDVRLMARLSKIGEKGK